MKSSLFVDVSNNFTQVKSESYQWGNTYNQSRTVNKPLERNHIYFWYQDRSALGIFTHEKVIYQNCGITVHDGVASIPVTSVVICYLFDVF